jgi:drug/metabolite transporter (DMT)-like permease
MTNNGTAIDTRSRVLSWVALAVVYVVWGSTYLAIRVGVGHLPPLLFAGTRYVIAGSLLYPVARRAASGRRAPAQDSAQHGTKPGVQAWLAGAVIGILLLFAGNGGVSFAETTLPSGFAAVLVATVPLWMILFAWPVQHQRVTVRSAAALAVGLGGVIILVGGGTALGRISSVVIVLGAAAAWGFGSVLSHRIPVPSHAMLAAAIEMLAGGVVLLAVGAGSGEFSRIHWSSVPATSWIALAYLIVPGSILAFTAYGYALSHLPVTTVSTYAYVNPVVAVLAGVVVLGEQFTWREGLGAALVLASVVITLRRSSDRADRTAIDGDHRAGGVGRGGGEHERGHPAELPELAVPAQRDALGQAGAHLVRVSLQRVEFPDPVGGDPDRQQPVDPDAGRAEFPGQRLDHPGQTREQPVGDGQFRERHPYRRGQHEDDRAACPSG